MGTAAKAHEGMSETNRAFYIDDDVAGAADDADWSITMPEAGVPSLPIVKAVITYGAGLAGARVATYHPVVNVGSALVGVEVVSYAEATGILTLTNRSGGALANIRTILEWVPVTE